MRTQNQPGSGACLTCDLVDSKGQPARAEVQVRIETALRAANAEFASELVVPLAVTLGDEWQGLLRSVEAALRVDFRLRRALHPLRLRSGVGWGALGSELRERTALMDGPCFHRSRAALVAAKKRRGAACLIETARPELDALLNAFDAVLQGVMDGWTARQFECVMAFLDHGSETSAARALHIAQPTLHKSVAGALGKELLGALEARNRYLADRALPEAPA